MNNIYGKTAVAFEVSCKAGAIAAKLKEKEIVNFANYGKCFGILFQIRDDLLDFQADISEKTGFIDFVSGIYTLPIIQVAENISAKVELRTIAEELKSGECRVEESKDKLVEVLSKYEWKDSFFSLVEEKYCAAIESLMSLQQCETVSYLKNILDVIKKDIYLFTNNIGISR